MKLWSSIGATQPFRRKLRCSFCRRSEHEVERLVGGAAGYICDSCVAECVQVLQETGGFPKSEPTH